MPVRVLHRMHEHAVHIPAHLLAAPLEAEDMEILREAPRGLPGAAHLPVPLLLRRLRDVQGHVVAVVVLGVLAAQLEHIDFRSPLGIGRAVLLLEPERAGAAGFHGSRLDLVIAVAGARPRVQRGGGVIVITRFRQVRRDGLLAHGEVKLAAADAHVGRVEPRRLPPAPPGHADDPFVRVQCRAVELVPHRLELHPAAAVRLVRERKALGEALRAFAHGAFQRPLLDGFLVETVRPHGRPRLLTPHREG